MDLSQFDRKVQYIEFSVTDLPRAKQFFGEAFGWTFRDYGPEYVAFSDGRMDGGFSKADAVRPGGPLVILYALALEQMLEQVRAAGGTIVQDIYSFPGGRRFHFADPSGNELAVWSDR